MQLCCRRGAWPAGFLNAKPGIKTACNLAAGRRAAVQSRKEINPLLGNKTHVVVHHYRCMHASSKYYVTRGFEKENVVHASFVQRYTPQKITRIHCDTKRS